MSKMQNTFKWTKASSGSGKTYTGISPIIVDNNSNEISLDKTDLATIKYVNKQIKDVNEVLKAQEALIDKNVIDISLRYTKAETLDLLNGKVNANYFNQEINKKQNKLIAGNNITIDEATNTISSSGGSGEAWEILSFTKNKTGFNILNITQYKKIKLSTTTILKLNTTVEPDYMGSWIAPNTLDLLNDGIISIPLTTNESSNYYVGGYIELHKTNGSAVFKVRYLSGGVFSVTSTTEWAGDIIVRGVKK